MRAADRPIGPFSDDSYLDFCVTEAVILSEMTANRTANKAQREKDILDQWKAGRISSEDAQRQIAALDED